MICSGSIGLRTSFMGIVPRQLRVSEHWWAHEGQPTTCIRPKHVHQASLDEYVRATPLLACISEVLKLWHRSGWASHSSNEFITREALGNLSVDYRAVFNQALLSCNVCYPFGALEPSIVVWIPGLCCFRSLDPPSVLRSTVQFKLYIYI